MDDNLPWRMPRHPPHPHNVRRNNNRLCLFPPPSLMDRLNHLHSPCLCRQHCQKKQILVLIAHTGIEINKQVAITIDMK